jgi:probable rRNA maturation factor
MITVELHIATRSRKHLPKHADFQRWVRAVAQKLAYTDDKEIGIKIVDTEEITDLNTQYRNKPSPTNVLSFPYDDDDAVLGDIALCAAQIEKEAIAQKTPLMAHWAHMTVHGMLHILGHTHRTDRDAQKMEQLESQILQDLGYANPYGV